MENAVASKMNKIKSFPPELYVLLGKTGKNQIMWIREDRLGDRE